MSYASQTNLPAGRRTVVFTQLTSLNTVHGRLFLLTAAALLAAISLLSQAGAQAVAPLTGVLGQVQSVEAHSLVIQTKTGPVHLDIARPLITYHQVPSSLSHITDNSYIGVASVEDPNGSEIAKQVFIFPPELRGAAEGSVLLDSPAAATHSRMTNGSVSRPAAAAPHSRMTNGIVEKGSGTTLVVHYQDGSQTILVPADAVITQVVPAKVALTAGDAVYAETEKRPDGALTTSRIFVVSEPAPAKTQ
jgi:hypothetical protein